MRLIKHGQRRHQAEPVEERAVALRQRYRLLEAQHDKAVILRCDLHGIRSPGPRHAHFTVTERRPRLLKLDGGLLQKLATMRKPHHRRRLTLP